jgi:transcriptional regulator NrdR family protein
VSRELVPKFYCIVCGHETVARVLETRGIRRRRECVECGDTYPTLEVLAPRRKPPRHVSRRLEPFLPFDV